MCYNNSNQNDELSNNGGVKPTTALRYIHTETPCKTMFRDGEKIIRLNKKKLGQWSTRIIYIQT